MSSYFISGAEASPEDLHGDIDAYAVRKNLTGTVCATAAKTPVTAVSRPVSDLLGDYYTKPSTALGSERADKIKCFIESIGGKVAGKTISNRTVLAVSMESRVFEFAEAFYANLTSNPVLGPGDRALLRTTTPQAIEKFLKFLESKL
jgi:hypothetical protein